MEEPMKEGKKVEKIYSIVIKYKTGNALKTTVYDDELDKMRSAFSVSRKYATKESKAHMACFNVFSSIKSGKDSELMLDLNEVQHIEATHISSV